MRGGFRGGPGSRGRGGYPVLGRPTVLEQSPKSDSRVSIRQYHSTSASSPLIADAATSELCRPSPIDKRSVTSGIMFGTLPSKVMSASSSDSGTDEAATPFDHSPEFVDSRVRALLNKLTMEQFDSISDQIIVWANKSKVERDARTLIQVIRLVFEKAVDEEARSEMYARLCRKMMEQISPKVQDEGIKNAEGKPIAGGQLFRKYLLNRCQEDFERRWAAKENTAAAAATKASEDQAAKDVAEKDESGEAALCSEEYYTAEKAKRQGLGLIKFIGELFKLRMLTERIMHECVKKLQGNVETPEEEEIESLCKLLATVGESLDTPKARAHMDVYFSRMKELAKNPNINSRMQFMLVDDLELRDRRWKSRHAAAVPTPKFAVHALAAKEAAAKEKDHQRTLSMSRAGSSGDREQHPVGPDGWAVAGNAPLRVPSKAGDLSNFGKVSKTNSMTFGPTGVFAKDKDKRESASLSCGPSNMFTKPSVDLRSAVASQPPQRRKICMLPSTLPKADETSSPTPAPSDAGHSDDEDSHAPPMSEAEAKTRVGEDSKEFFSIRDLDEAEVYFMKLPSKYRWLLVDKLVASAIESKEADAQLVGDFFSQAALKNICSPDHLEKGFVCTAEILDDIAIDAPKAFSLMAIMMNGAQLDEERWIRLSSKVEDPVKLICSYKPRKVAMPMKPSNLTLPLVVFTLRDLCRAEKIVSELPQQQRWTAVDVLVKYVLESKAEEVDFVAELFSRLASKDICSLDAFEEGFTASADVLLDTMQARPKANYLMATMQKGAGLSGAQRIRLAGRALQGRSRVYLTRQY
ncbi:hypothetical protein FOMPIDRAFT_1163031 [Fomitopsis schrenkii]|uniref:MI domain-containing protein n=1 Tax=Fomitopsis schrenkii TaxID=2126942 RepID=S8E5K9_FOMSC|nr:hypothetical protein FOMPIDRAFT_1163031 [Fomitopsis schrenkii]